MWRKYFNFLPFIMLIIYFSLLSFWNTRVFDTLSIHNIMSILLDVHDSNVSSLFVVASVKV